VSSSYLLSALLIGLGAGLHCVGMCSPLQITILFKNETQTNTWRNWIIYQASRISVYGIYGMIFGWMGSSLKWFGIQQNISITVGAFILIAVIVIKMFPLLESRMSNNQASSWLRKKISPYIFAESISSKIMAGVLNGILPCGMVYVALAGATAMQSPLAGGLFMICFGIGTVPLLLATSIMGKYVQSVMKNYTLKWYPYMIGLVAILLIFRGLNMGNIWSPTLIHSSNASIQCSTR
jgi:sulfite exporter TauE/SafE